LLITLEKFNQGDNNMSEYEIGLEFDKGLSLDEFELELEKRLAELRMKKLTELGIKPIGSNLHVQTPND
jgi:hypothetical protein